MPSAAATFSAALRVDTVNERRSNNANKKKKQQQEQAAGCRDAGKVDRNRWATLTELGRVLEACQSSLQKACKYTASWIRADEQEQAGWPKRQLDCLSFGGHFSNSETNAH